MNHEPDFDRTIRSWLDNGADRAPERFVWAALQDVERTAQRSAAWALLETAMMKLKPAAPILGVAAVVLVAIVAYQFLGGNVGVPPESTPTPTPRAYVAEDLPAIVAAIGTAPEGMIVDGTTVDVAALVAPEHPTGPKLDRSRLVDALMTSLDTTDLGGFASWAALFDTTASAQAAYEVLVAIHATEQGWAMEAQQAVPGLGDESASYEGAAYEFETARVHFWRSGNLLLAAVAAGDAAVGDANADRLRALAEGMDDRAD
jgi:hypothetical protein